MALIYRAHFAFISRPIITSKGVNASAMLGFANTLLDILRNQKPTHLAVAFDTPEPTERHVEFPAYKAQREEMPEDLAAAIPDIKRLCAAMNIPVLEMPGYEADDVVGTIVRQTEQQGFENFMVTPDKDFAQLVSEHTFIYKPGRQGNDVEILGVPEVKKKWGIDRVEQVIDILGLAGDASDNIPGVPGVGEKTAVKLIAQFGSVEGLLANTDQLKGKQKEKVEENREQALLSKKLATINCQVPIPYDLEDLKVSEPNETVLKELLIEFEFNAIGKRMFGNDFKTGRGFESEPTSGSAEVQGLPIQADNVANQEPKSDLKTIADVSHKYSIVSKPADRQKLAAKLKKLKSFCFDTETTGLDPRSAVMIGLSFSWEAHQGVYVQLTAQRKEEDSLFAQFDDDSMREEVLGALADFTDVFGSESVLKIGHNLKFDLAVLRHHGVDVRGPMFDTMLAHSLIEPELRHGMDFLAESHLGYTPISIKQLIGDKKGNQENMANVPLDKLGEYAAEDADVTWQLYEKFLPLLKEREQENVFYEIEMPLLPVLVDMEAEGVRIDAETLGRFSIELEKQMAVLEKRVHELAGGPFNLNSPKQLGELLFDKLKLTDKAKKTKTGQYATDEQTLVNLSGEHEIVRALLEFRTLTKLKSTYADALPQSISKKTGRVHTNFQQAATATGRLASNNPNLQNIPIRTELGQEIRRAFVPRDEHHTLLSADYSQIELRIIAALSKDAAMLEAFASGEDIHTATAARVYGVALSKVTGDQRRNAKMVNFGIIYGISAFGLSQRLGIPRKEAAEIIEQYFGSYPGIRKYLDDTIEFARKTGYVETVSGRRRFIRDINSANGTVRGGAERFAINTPIQGTAADMIKLAMSAIRSDLRKRKLKSKLILQVHDELVFDLFNGEEEQLRELVQDRMKSALKLDVPILVEIGTGKNWLEAH